MRALLDLLLPVDCAGCGVPGAPWCPDCAVLLGRPVRVYPPGCSAGPPVYALGAYCGRLRTALLAYKERGRRDLGVPLGGALATALLQLPPGSGPGGMCLVPVPSRRSAAARRGGQHVTLLAQRAAAALADAGMAAAVAPALRMAPGYATRSASRPPPGRPIWRAGCCCDGPAYRLPARPSCSSTMW